MFESVVCIPIFLSFWWITLGKNILPDLKVIAVWITYCIVNLFHGTSRLPAIQLEAWSADKAEWHVTSRKLKFSADGCVLCDVTMTLHWRRPEYSLFHQNRLNCLPRPQQVDILHNEYCPAQPISPAQRPVPEYWNVSAWSKLGNNKCASLAQRRSRDKARRGVLAPRGRNVYFLGSKVPTLRAFPWQWPSID